MLLSDLPLPLGLTLMLMCPDDGHANSQYHHSLWPSGFTLSTINRVKEQFSYSCS